jgi:hypothetical protein
MNIKSELHQKSRELLDWLNEKLTADEQMHLMFGKGKSIILIFADESAPKALQEYAAHKIFDPVKAAKLLEQAMHKARVALDSGEIIAAHEAVEQAEDLAKRIKLEECIDPAPSIHLIFEILAGIGSFCEKHYHDRAKLKELIAAINKLY